MPMEHRPTESQAAAGWLADWLLAAQSRPHGLAAIDASHVALWMQLLSMGAHKMASSLLNLPFTPGKIVSDDLETRAVLGHLQQNPCHNLHCAHIGPHWPRTESM